MTKKDAELKAIEAELNARTAALPHDQQVLVRAAVSTFKQALMLGAMIDIDGRCIFVEFVNAQLKSLYGARHD